MKKTICLLMALLLIVSSTIITKASNNTLAKVSYFLPEEIYQNVKQNDLINQAFSKQSSLLIEYSSILEFLSDEQSGGAFFDDDGFLHILITEDISNTLSSRDDIYFDLVKYSYNQLKEFQSCIIYHREDIGFKATGINQKNNTVVIYSADDLDTDLLYRLVPKESIEIVPENTYTQDCSTYTVIPGQQLTNITRGWSGSIACGVVWDESTSNPKYGFMTAGHLGFVGDNVYYSGASMGTITARQQWGSVDAALIQRGQNGHIFNFGDQVADGKIFTAFGGTYPMNTVIYGYGATTTYGNQGTISGVITDTSYADFFDSIYFTDLVKTNATNQPGDSGGPVLTSYGNNYAIIGIMKGLSNGNMVYVTMDSITASFDLSVMAAS